REVRFVPLPRYPAVQRDMALLVPKAVPAAAVVETIRRAGGQLVESVSLFDVYEGPQVEAGQRSLAFSIRLRHRDRTPTDEEANAVVDGAERALRAELGAPRRVRRAAGAARAAGRSSRAPTRRRRRDMWRQG